MNHEKLACIEYLTSFHSQLRSDDDMGRSETERTDWLLGKDSKDQTTSAVTQSTPADGKLKATSSARLLVQLVEKEVARRVKLAEEIAHLSCTPSLEKTSPYPESFMSFPTYHAT